MPDITPNAADLFTEDCIAMAKRMRLAADTDDTQMIFMACAILVCWTLLMQREETRKGALALLRDMVDRGRDLFEGQHPLN